MLTQKLVPDALLANIRRAGCIESKAEDCCACTSYNVQDDTWAAQCYTGILIKLTSKGVVFSFLFYKMTSAEAACLSCLLWPSVHVPCLPCCPVVSFKALWVNQCLLLLPRKRKIPAAILHTVSNGDVLTIQH